MEKYTKWELMSDRLANAVKETLEQYADNYIEWKVEEFKKWLIETKEDIVLRMLDRFEITENINSFRIELKIDKD